MTDIGDLFDSCPSPMLCLYWYGLIQAILKPMGRTNWNHMLVMTGRAYQQYTRAKRMLVLESNQRLAEEFRYIGTESEWKRF
jgi:hypothetical protein